MTYLCVLKLFWDVQGNSRLRTGEERPVAVQEVSPRLRVSYPKLAPTLRSRLAHRWVGRLCVGPLLAYDHNGLITESLRLG